MKRSVITLIILTIMLLITTTQNLMPKKTEITLLKPAIAIGFDREKDNNINKESKDLAKATMLLSDLRDGGENGGSSNEKFIIYSGIGKTQSKAIENIQKKSSKSITASTIGYFLLGEEAVKKDIDFFTDFISKDNNFRKTALIYFVKDSTAHDALNVINKMGTVDILKIRGENSGLTAISSYMKLVEFLQYYVGDNTSVAVPTVRITEEGKEKRILPEGYAIVNERKVVGYIEDGMARGYNILKNKEAYSVIEIPLKEDTLGMILQNSNSKINFEFEKNRLVKIKITANLYSDVQDSSSVNDIESDEVVKEIQNNQSKVIRDEMINVINLSKKYRSDFLGLGQAMKLQHPYRWELLKDNWIDILETIPVEVEVFSKLQRTFDMIELR